MLRYFSALARRAVPAGILAGPAPEAGQLPPPSFPESPYRVLSGAAQVGRFLEEMHRSGSPVRLNVRDQAQLFQVRIKGVDTARQQLLITQVWNDTIHAALLADRRPNLGALHRGIPVLFSAPVTGTLELDGSLCYRLPFPDWMLVLELRDCYRVHLPLSLGASLHFPGAARPLQARVLDLSETGIQFELAPGALLPRNAAGTACPAELHIRGGRFALQVRPRWKRRRDSGTWQIGATIELESEPQRRTLRQLIVAAQTRIYR
jgi:hypothetical protein